MSINCFDIPQLEPSPILSTLASLLSVSLQPRITVHVHFVSILPTLLLPGLPCLSFVSTKIEVYQPALILYLLLVLLLVLLMLLLLLLLVLLLLLLLLLLMLISTAVGVVVTATIVVSHAYIIATAITTTSSWTATVIATVTAAVTSTESTLIHRCLTKRLQVQLTLLRLLGASLWHT